MRVKTYEVKTLAEAKELAIKDFCVGAEDIKLEVLKETKGFLGIGGKNAKVEINKKENDGERASNFLNGLFELMKIPATTELKENGDKISAEDKEKL